MLESTITLSYYDVYSESICGGSSAGPTWHSIGGVHTHMTNTCAMDPKVLEKRIPILIRNFSLRTGSGGDGVIRVFEPQSHITFALGNERHCNRPYSLKGGKDGYAGINLARINHPTGKRFVNISPRGIITLQRGEQL